MLDTLHAEAASRALAQFGRADLVRGKRYHQERRVRGLRREDDVAGHVLFVGTVRGSAYLPYEAYLVFQSKTGNLVDAECTCPLGGYCKHCVAALSELEQRLREGRWPEGTTAPDEPRLDPGVHAWLQTLETAGRLPVHAGLPAHPEERLRYTLSLVSRQTVPSLQLRVERGSVDGDASFLPPRIVDPARVDWARDPAVLPGDHGLVVRMGPFSMGHVVLEKTHGARILSDLVATGRAFLTTRSDERLRLSEGSPRTGELSFETREGGWQSPSLAVEGGPALLPVTPPFYVDLSTGATGPVVVAGLADDFTAAWIRGTAFPPEVAAKLADRLAAARLPVHTPRPRVRRVREVLARPSVVLRLESQPVTPAAGPTTEPPSAPQRPWARVFFDYGGERVDPSAPLSERITEDEIVRVRRSEEAESALLASLADEGLVSTRRAFVGLPSPPGLTLAMSSKLSPFAIAPRVTALASADVRVEKAPDYAWNAVVADDVQLDLDDVPALENHFAVSLGIRIGEETVDALPVVLAALREGVPEEGESLLVTLPDGRTLEVPAARLSPLRRLLLELLDQRDPGRVSRVRALALDPAVLARSPESLARLRAALATPRKAAVPRRLSATLRGYQRDGFVWLMARRRAHLGAVLADDMGLGKTVQTLALLLAEDRGGVPSLVVCPKTVLGNWQAETQRFAPSLKVHVHHGADRASRLPAFAAADVVLTTYPLLARDADLFASQRFATVVLDEAQTIKTAASTVTHAACALRADFRLALSGTPMENHLGELWSVMRFVLPELFGEAKSFARGFRRPIEKAGSEGARLELVRRLAPFVLRRRKDQVASELPPKTIIVESVELDQDQRDVYETVRAAMDTRVRQALAERGIGQSHIIVLDALLKLRQAVCDPRLLRTKTSNKAGSAKLDVLVDKLRELVAEGRRVLVFSQFVTMLELVQKELRREGIPFLLLTGQTNNRSLVVEAFQRGDAPVFLLSLKAGGAGLNLTAADVVIHYDPWWNPAAEAQATDRAHRIGQDKPVLVYKLVGKSTIEEKILGLQDKKRALFASILDDGAGVAKSLTAADVEFLFAR